MAAYLNQKVLELGEETKAIEVGCLKALELAIEVGYLKVLELVIEGGCLKVLELAIAGDYQKDLELAIEGGCQKVLEWASVVGYLNQEFPGSEIVVYYLNQVVLESLKLSCHHGQEPNMFVMTPRGRSTPENHSCGKQKTVNGVWFHSAESRREAAVGEVRRGSHRGQN